MISNSFEALGNHPKDASEQPQEQMKEGPPEKSKQHNTERKGKEPVYTIINNQQDIPQQEEDILMVEDKDFNDLGSLDLMALEDACHRNTMSTIPPK